jgi:hypothetical protein
MPPRWQQIRGHWLSARVFFAWWYGAVIAIPGAVDAGLSGLLGQEMDRGIFMMILVQPSPSWAGS